MEAHPGIVGRVGYHPLWISLHLSEAQVWKKREKNPQAVHCLTVSTHTHTHTWPSNRAMNRNQLWGLVPKTCGIWASYTERSPGMHYTDV